jgi:hypothetical protein
MDIKERSSLFIEDELNFVHNCYNKIRSKHKNIVKKSRDLFLQIKYIKTDICDTPVSDNTLWLPLPSTLVSLKRI